MRIRISVGDVSLEAELNDSPTARKIASILPFEAGFQTWGDEIYFEIPVTAELEADAKEEVSIGDLGFWPTGNAFCIFFGPTPMSRGDKIVPASAVNVVGRVLGDATRLKAVMGENKIRLELL
ncbi:MAG: hypothetical protein DRH12_06665 [Deltaproteobacteria bacterium]|nr:MAG: hypothetical protein DRH12_06665 [Deltaproteobacteria bacterium]RLB86137.1 MAG: hypothetical protein DRH15_02360 [Deltaproteobacteria bacterium]